MKPFVKTLDLTKTGGSYYLLLDTEITEVVNLICVNNSYLKVVQWQ
jgi:hypothetical protein